MQHLFPDIRHLIDIDAFASLGERVFDQLSAASWAALVFIVACGIVAAWLTALWLCPRCGRRWRRAYVFSLYAVPPFFVLGPLALLGGLMSTELPALVTLAAGLFALAAIPAFLLEMIFRPVRPLRLALRILVWLFTACLLFALTQPQRDLDYVLTAASETSLSFGPLNVSLMSLANGVATGVVMLVIAHGSVNWLHKRLDSHRRLPPNFALAIGRILDFLVWTLATTVVLKQAGIDMKAVAAFAGALGIGLGLGLQRLAASYVCGLIVLFERSVRVGDTITANGIKGRVTQMTVRYTTLMSADGVEALVPNDMLTINPVLNQSWSDTTIRLTSSTHIDIASDVTAARNIVLEILHAQTRVLATPAPGVYVADIADGRIRLEAQFWIADPLAGQLNLISDVNAAILAAFAAHGIRFAPLPALRAVSL